MRDAINQDEEDRLVRAVQSGKSWDEVRGMLYGVDPEALDRGFKAQVLRKAGVVEPALEPPPMDSPPVEKPTRRSKG